MNGTRQPLVSVSGIAALLFLFIGPVTTPAGAAALEREHLRLDVVIAGDSYALETLIVRPDSAGKKPLALVSHGSPRGNYTNRRRMTPNRLLTAAEEFAARGYLAAIVMRREYGQSDGNWSEDYGPCDNPDYVAAGNGTADDIAAAVAVLAGRPDVDATRVLLVGHSAGGFGSVAAGARGIAGLRGVINFAGGRGSRSSGNICGDDALIDAYGVFGRTSPGPGLWIYAENDAYFPPALARRFHGAFTTAGGKAELILTPAIGKDGHSLFTAGAPGFGLWREPVDRYLVARGLPTWARPPALTLPDLPPPTILGERGRDHWQRYLAAPENKAFALDGDGRFGWRSGRRTVEDARNGAIRNCKGDCRIVSVNGAEAK